jgi:hypothetical protein
MLAAEFVAKRAPAGLNRLVIASSLASMDLWSESVNSLVKQLPEDLQEKLKKHEKDGTTDSPEYQEIMQIFYGKHICTTVLDHLVHQRIWCTASLLGMDRYYISDEVFSDSLRS